MKRLLTNATAAALSLLLCSTFTACDRNLHNDPGFTQAELNESDNDAFAENSYNDVATMVDDAAINNEINQRNGRGYQTILSHCATITHDTTTSPRTLIIDFGTTNCQGHDGRMRRGKIIVSYTGRYRQAGTTITIHFENYFVNDNQLLGTKTITNNDRNAAGNLSFSISVDGKIRFVNGDSATWQSARVREWVAGDQTHLLADDIYQITGSGSGTRANGTSYTAEILQLLVRKMAPNCNRYFVQGVLRITPQGRNPRTIDFGNGECDNLATLTVNGRSRTIVLR